MNMLEQLGEGLNRAWDSIAEGWRQLRERASSAITRFNPVRHGGELETVDDQVARHGARWGLLAAEVSESDNEVVVRLEVPGMERENFELAVVDERILSVRGEKRVTREEKHGHYHLMECAYGSFERVIPLPAAVDESGTRARYRRGVLQVTLPKLRHHSARRINVEGG